MARQKPRRVIQIERLEDRNLLANTADIILIIDDSESMTSDALSNDRAVLTFVTDEFLPALDQKLADAEIGTEEPNRFGIVTFGGGMRPEGGVFNTLYQTWGPGGSSNSHPTPRPIPLDLSAGDWDPVDQTPAAKAAEAETLKRVYLAPIPIQTNDPGDPGLAEIINDLPEADGQSEDSWQAVDYVFTVEYHADDPVFSFIDENEDGVNDIAAYLPTGPLYDFREDAAVHFILISDTGRIRHWGDWPVLPWDVTLPDAPVPGIYGDQWADWDDVSLESLTTKLSRGGDGTNDIGLTAFVPAKFEPLSNDLEPGGDFGELIFDPTEEPILGVDVNVIDGWNVDKHDPMDSDWLAGLQPETDDYVVFHAEGITGAGTGEVVAASVQGNLLDKIQRGDDKGDPITGYKPIIEELSCWPDSWSHTHRDDYLYANDYFFNYDAGIVDQDQIDQITGWEGNHIHGVEEAAFLAWEAKGTVWTSAYLGFDMIGDTLEYPPADPDPVKFNRLMDLLGDEMAQDIVDKISIPRIMGVTIASDIDTDTYSMTCRAVLVNK